MDSPFSPTHWLELKVPPPVVLLVAAASMWLASTLVAPVPVPSSLRTTIAVLLACAGAAIDVAALVTFRRASTTFNPMRPGTASALVTSGVFRFSRNPMYLGMVLYLVGWAVYLSSWPAVGIVPLFVLYIHRFQIAPEERVLASLFGASYTAYRDRVGRWL